MLHALNIIFLFFGAVLSVSALGSDYSLSYSGRITLSDGAPVAGTITLRVEFFRDETGGAALPVTFGDKVVTLKSGVFQIPIKLSNSDFHLVFNGEDNTWIQITDLTNGKTYPRQSFSAVPYALKVPIDTNVLAYDADGKLTLSATPEDGKVLSSVGGELQWIPAAGGGDMMTSVYGSGGTGTVNDSDKLGGQAASFYRNASNINSGTLPTAQVPNLSANKITTGTMDPDRIAQNASNRFVTDAEKTSWNTALGWGNHAGAGYINLNSISAAGAPLSYNSTTGQFSISQASGATPGYISASDYSSFSSKQQAITASSNITLDQLTAKGSVRLDDADGSHGVTIKAADTTTANYTLSMPDAAPATNGQLLSVNTAGQLSWVTPGGGGDMMRSTYDTNTNGKVDSAETADNATQLNGQAASYYLNAANLTGTIDDARIPGGITRDSEMTIAIAAATSGAMLKSVYDSNDDGKVNAAATADSADTATNATQLNGQAASYYLNATNITTGTLPAAQVPNLSAGKITSGTMDPARIAQDASNRFVTDVEKNAWNAKQSAITASSDITLDQLIAKGDIRVDDADGSHGVTIKAADVTTANYTISLPAAAPTLNGQILSVDTAGQLSWASPGGGGDMMRSTYDTNTNGKVDTAETADNATQLNGQAASYYLNAGNLTGTIDDARIPAAVTRDSEVPSLARAAISGSTPITFNGATGAIAITNATTSAAGAMSAADKVKLDGISSGAGVVDATTVGAAGAVMDSDFSTNGLMVRTGAGTYSSVTNNATNWDTAYSDRLKWDGGATGLNAATGRTSLGLGSMATQNANAVAITGGTISGVTMTLANDSISGDKIDGGTISNFASTGIDDNADELAITIDASERVGIGVAPTAKLHVGGTAGVDGIRFPDGTLQTSAASPVSMRDQYWRLRVTNGGTPDTQVTVTAGAVILENDAGSVLKASNVNVTATITSAGANGLDSGAEAASTWYHIWVISDGSTTASLLSVSESTPTMPGAYTYKAYVGSVFNNASSNFIRFNQHDRRVYREELQVLTNGTSSAFVALALTAALPTTARFISGNGGLSSATGGTNYEGFFLRPDSTSTVGQNKFVGYSEVGGGFSSSEGLRWEFHTMLNSAQTLFYRCYSFRYSSGANNCSGGETAVRIFITGWEY